MVFVFLLKTIFISNGLGENKIEIDKSKALINKSLRISSSFKSVKFLIDPKEPTKYDIRKYLKKDKSMKYPSRPNLRKFIYYTFSLIEVKNEEIINEYLTLKKLNLKYH